MCRYLSPFSALDELLPLVVDSLTSKSLLVYSTAAATLERLLTVRHTDKTPYLNFRTNPAVQQQLNRAADRLMLIVAQTFTTTDNEYVMRCLWRLLAVVQTESKIECGDVGVRSVWVCQVCGCVRCVKWCFFTCHSASVQAERLRSLVSILQAAAVRLVNPVFVHYLYEAVTVMARIVAVSLQSPEQSFEVHQYITATMTAIIQNEETHSFVPYCYQVTAHT